MNELTKTEEIIMLAIWRMEQPICLSSVMEALQSDPRAKDWRPQTISTYFRKLAEKKYLKMNRNGKIYTYQILIAKEKYRDYLAKNILINFFDNDKKLFINAINKS